MASLSPLARSRAERVIDAVTRNRNAGPIQVPAAMPGASGSSDGAGRLPSGAVLTAVAPLLRAPLKPYDRTRTILAGHWLFAVVLTLAAA